jgi:hypothetical protein
MNNKDKNKQQNRIEEALYEIYKEDVQIDEHYLQNLNKIVVNTINGQKIKEQRRLIVKTKKEKGFFSMIFTGVKWQVAFLTSFLGVLLFGGVAFAAVPGIKEAVLQTPGELYVNSEPEGASVRLSGGKYSNALLGTTPLQLKIKPGNYQVDLELDNYEQYSTMLAVTSGKISTLNITLSKKKSILDTIKEWKTYNDTDYGYEVTYPFDWTITKDIDEPDQSEKIPSTEITGENSKVKISHNLSDNEFSGTQEIIKINNKEYQGVKDQLGWKYILFYKIEASQIDRFLYISFYTKVEDEVAIFDFIKNSIQIYDVQPGEDVSKWNTYMNINLGISLKYPDGWATFEREKNSYEANYEIQSYSSEKWSLRILYSFGYLALLKEYIQVDNPVILNGIKSVKYCSLQCEDNFILELPNRLYLVYQKNEQEEINSEAQKILSTVTLTSENNFVQNVTDFSLGYTLTYPNNWHYEVISSASEFGEIQFTQISNSTVKIKIIPWDEVQDSWQSFMDTITGIKGQIRETSVKIGNVEYRRKEIWKEEKGTFTLQYIIYIQESSQDTIWNPKIQVNNQNIIVLVEDPVSQNSAQMLTVGEYQRELTIVDAIAASIRNSSPSLYE